MVASDMRKIVLALAICLWCQPALAEWTELHRAASQGNVTQILRLIAAGAAMEARDMEGSTPIHLAARQDHAEEVDALAKAGADVNARGEGGSTPLHEAAVWGNAPVIRLLVAAGAFVNATDAELSTPLHFAALNEQAHAVETLVTLGADVNASNVQGRTALHLAAFFGDVAAVEALTMASANLDARDNGHGDTPLHYAASNGQAATIRVLAAAGATIDIRNDNGQTPHSYAEEKGHDEAAEALQNAASIYAEAPLVMDPFSSGAGRSEDKRSTDAHPSGDAPNAADATSGADQANRLLVEAVRLIKASDLEPSANGKFALLNEAHDKLLEIVERHSATDLAVKLATGQAIGDISLEAIRLAMDRVRPVQPRAEGAPAMAWRHDAGVAAVALPRGGTTALSVDRSGLAALRDISTGELLLTWRHEGGLSDVFLTRRSWGGTSSVALSPGGQRILTAGRDGTVELRDTHTGNVLSEWSHDRAAGAVALSSDRRLAVVGVGQKVLLVDVDALEILRSWRHRSTVTTVAVAPDGQWVMAGLADGRAVLAEAWTSGITHAWEHRGSGGGGVMAAVFSTDARKVLTGAANGSAELRDVLSGERLWQWQLRDRATATAYSLDGRWLLTADEGYEVELHDAQTGQTVRKWRYDDSAEAVAFSPDGRQALMGFADGMVILCDIVVPRRREGWARSYLSSNEGCW